MKRFFLTAACTATLVCGTLAEAQNNVIESTSDAVQRTAGQVQQAVENTADDTDTRLGINGSATTNQQLNGGSSGIDGATTSGLSGQISTDRSQQNLQGNLNTGVNVQSYNGQQVYSTQQFNGNRDYGSGQQTFQSPARHGVHQAYPMQGAYPTSQFGYGGVQQTSGVQALPGNQWQSRGNAPMMHGGSVSGQSVTYGHYQNSGMASGGVYTLRHDSSGREFICVNGQPVYFDQQVQSLSNQNGLMPYDHQGTSANSSSPSQSSDANNERMQSKDESPNSSDMPPAPTPETETNGSTNQDSGVDSQTSSPDDADK